MKLTNLSIEELLELKRKVKRNADVLNSGLIFTHLEPVQKTQKLLGYINEEISKRGPKNENINYGQALFQN